MATYYVRKTGSDNNGGTSASIRSTGTDGVTNGTNTLTAASGTWSASDVGQGIFVGGVNQWRLITAVASATSLTFSGATIAAGSGRTWTIGGAWATIGKSLASTVQIVGGDTAYIGGGVYRETVTVGLTPSSVVTYIGDTSGAQTGDAGEVQWTNYTTNDTTAPSGSGTLTLGSGSNLKFQSIVFVCVGVAAISSSSSATGITFKSCVVLCNVGALNFTGAANVACNWTFDSCGMFFGGMGTLNVATSASADFDINFTVTNCVIVSSVSFILRLTPSGANSFKPGGVKFSNCTMFSAVAVIQTTAASSTTFPCTVYNSVIPAGSFIAQGAGQIVEDYNIFYSGTRTNVSAGAHDHGTEYAPLMDVGQSWLLLGLAVKPFGFPDGSGSPLLSFGNQASSPPADIMGFTRPGTPGVGAFELDALPSSGGMVLSRIRSGY